MSLELISEIKLKVKRKLTILLPGIIFAFLFILYQIGTSEVDTSSVVMVSTVLILGSILRYFIFPEKTLYILSQGKMIIFDMDRADDEEIERFITAVREQIAEQRVGLS